MTGLHWFADVQWFSMLLTGQFGIWHDITIYYPFSDIPTSIGTSVHVGGQKYGLWMCGIHTFGYFWGMKWHQWSAIYRSFHCPTFPAKKTSQKKNWHSWCVEDFCWGSMFDFFRVELAEVPRQDPWRPRVPRVPTHAPEVWNSLFASASDVEKNPWDSCFAKENYGKWSTNDGSTSMPHPIAGNYIWNRLKNIKKNWSGTFMFWCPPVKNSRPRPFLDNITSLPCLWSAKKRCPSPGGEFITHKEQLQSLLKISSHLEIQIIQNLFGLGNWVSTKWPTLTATKTSIQGARDKEGTWYSSSHSIVSPTLCPINPRLTILTSSHLTWQWKLSIFNWWIKTHAGDITGVVTYIQDGKKKLKSWWPPWTTRTFHKWVV